jgi:hypothetical protein
VELVFHGKSITYAGHAGDASTGLIYYLFTHPC